MGITFIQGTAFPHLILYDIIALNMYTYLVFSQQHNRSHFLKIKP